MSTPREPEGRSRAVVIGARLAGMSAARVLCDHFARVTACASYRPSRSSTARASRRC
jgi:glycine/D-amino acid oxidase-like deaminating enzyme